MVSEPTQVCKSVYVNNSPEEILKYSDCRIIKGNLQIVLMELGEDPVDFINKNFAKLYEITGYLMIFRVNSLVSLDVILPKLTVIKGENLFLGFSMIVYDVPHLEQIGLSNLGNISNGGIKIGSNPRLCYVDTVDWEGLGVSKLEYDRKANCDEQTCPNECLGHCINNYECQKIKHDNCHELCIGCTRSNSSKHCIQCKFFNDGGNCVESCPNNKIVEMGSDNCLTHDKCIKKKQVIQNSKCVPECNKASEKNASGVCVPVPRRCEGFKINNRFDLVPLKGCTEIFGAVEIILHGDVHFSDLERHLGEIVNITEYLKVVRSPSLTSLKFFKSLRRIKGESLWGGYAVFIAENQNLQEFFAKVPRVAKGEILFQNNANLCSSKIKRMNASVNVNNGYQTSCFTTELTVSVVQKNPTNVTLTWPKEADIVGYTVFYLTTETANFTARILDGFVDADGSPIENNWNNVFVTSNEVILKRLVPFTTYGYYIKTTFTSSKIRQSPIYFFKTSMGEPLEPSSFKVKAVSSSAINISWTVPMYTNGELAHYRLTKYREEDDLSLLRKRNYCFNPMNETNCTCPEFTDEIRILQSDKTCIGNNNYCTQKAVYHVEGLHVRKRSADNFEEIKIDATVQSHLVKGLKPYTLYTFYLQACNKKEGNESDLCGGSVTESIRTLKNHSDGVQNVSVKATRDSAVVSWSKPPRPNVAILTYNIEYKASNISRIQCLIADDLEPCCRHKISGLASGKYLLRVRAVSLAGSGEASPWVQFEVYPRTSSVGWLYAFFALLVMGALLWLAFIIWRSYRVGADTTSLIPRGHFEEEEEEEEWKLDEESVEIVRELGQNNLAMLYRRDQTA